MFLFSLTIQVENSKKILLSFFPLTTLNTVSEIYFLKKVV